MNNFINVKELTMEEVLRFSEIKDPQRVMMIGYDPERDAHFFMESKIHDAHSAYPFKDLTLRVRPIDSDRPDLAVVHRAEEE